MALGAADWLAARVLDEIGRPVAERDPSLYHGLAGMLLGLHESQHHFGDDRHGEVLERGTAALADHVDVEASASLYYGQAGLAMTLRVLGRGVAADRALAKVRAAFDGERWNDMFELLVGNAGIALGALHAGDLDLAVTAVTPYLTTADRTTHGVNWAVRPSPARSHHVAHGTLGIVIALAQVGAAAGRDDLVELALAGAADVVGRNEAGPDGFLVPHSDPPHRPDIIERYSYGWCNGPAGDAQAFRLLAQVTGDAEFVRLGDACWHTVLASGLPQRLRPGFWDNNGRCCGTAGVLALACDRVVERGDDLTFANVLVDDLLTRVIVDADGARWSNHEHRATPSALEPLAGWAMGNAGIVRELLRYVRLVREVGTGYAVSWPDHPDSGASGAILDPGKGAHHGQATLE
jgi:hypothetical protein